VKHRLFINITIFLFILMSPLEAQDGVPDVGTKPVIRGVYFTETGCSHCDVFLYVQKKKYEAASGVQLELETYDILSAEGYKRCADMLAERGLVFTVFPVLFIGNNVYRGSTEIETNVPLELAALRETGTLRPALVLDHQSGQSFATQDQSEQGPKRGALAQGPGVTPSGGALGVDRLAESQSLGKSLGILATIFSAGLLDGINPCAFSTLLFFLSFISLRRYDRRSLLLVGLSFIGAVFLAYFLIGLGFLQVLRALLSAGRATLVVKALVSVFAVFLVVLNLRDAHLARQGRVNESALQLPAPLKRLTHRVIRSFSMLPLFILGAALSGFLVSIIELACTGQVYLPTLVYLNQSALSHWSILLLLLYNAGFILPLSLVFVFYLFGLQHEKLRAWYGSRIVLVRFFTAALFAVMAVVVWV
jgi:cytochrome c biogenesis protein CcdA